MKVVDAICEILKREGVEFLSCYPTNTLIEAAASAGITPIVCRPASVGVGIAACFTRAKGVYQDKEGNTKKLCQFSQKHFHQKLLRPTSGATPLISIL